MLLTYRGQRVAEIVPTEIPQRKPSPLEALNRAQALRRASGGTELEAAAYLKELRDDQRNWSSRRPL